MTSKPNSIRRSLLATTALVGLSFAILAGGANEALAACPVVDGGTIGVTSGNTGALSTAGTPLEIGGAGGTVTVNGNITSTGGGACAIYVGNLGDNKTIDFGAVIVSTNSAADPAIRLNDGATGNLLTFTGTTVNTGGGPAIVDGDGSNEFVIGDGTTINGTIDLGPGNDTITLHSGSSVDLVLGGSGSDTLKFSGPGTKFYSAGDLREFSTVEMNGTGTVTLLSSFVVGPNSLIINSGTLAIAGSILANNTAINGATLRVEPGGLFSSNNIVGSGGGGDDRRRRHAQREHRDHPRRWQRPHRDRDWRHRECADDRLRCRNTRRDQVLRVG